MDAFELYKLKKRIDQLGLKKKHLANQWRISPARLSQFLSGKFVIPADIEAKMKKTLGL